MNGPAQKIEFSLQIFFSNFILVFKYPVLN